jgi:hypothetical protein
MANHARTVSLARAESGELERLQRSSAGPAGLSRRARAVLLMAGDVPGAEVAPTDGLHRSADQPHSTAFCRGRLSRTRTARDFGQLLHSFDPRGSKVARAASQRQLPLHPDRSLVAQHD